MLSAAKWGALVGVAIYLVSEIITVITRAAFGSAPADPNHPGVITLGCLQLLLVVFAFSAAGFYAGRETRNAGFGAIAGMVTFAIYGALLAIYSFGGRASLGASGLPEGALMLVDITTVVFYLIIAALIGWLGGRPGASRGRAQASRLAAQATHEPVGGAREEATGG